MDEEDLPDVADLQDPDTEDAGVSVVTKNELCIALSSLSGVYHELRNRFLSSHALDLGQCSVSCCRAEQPQ